MRAKTLEVVLTKTFDRRPLATVRNLPGEDADMSPQYMRALAEALIAAADECEARTMGKHFMMARRSYSLEIDHAC